ncbi:MAG: hypothetical protein KIT87_16490 [Anaerolineae bacterium]|nr:hypothetical protein [Anaerolineae bacterium]
MWRMARSRLSPLVGLALVVFVGFAVNSALAENPGAPDAAPSAAWCGSLGEYTAWYWPNWYQPKPALFVWKNGAGKPNPTNLTVKFNGQTVANADDGIRTGSPQIDLRNGWVGYYLSTRWYLGHPQWDDDWRWNVTGCLP